MSDSTGTISCPNCGRAATVVWAKSRNDLVPPLCKSCFYRHLSLDTAQPADYTPYYLPAISHTGPLWTIQPNTSYTTSEIRRFVRACLATQYDDPEDTTTTHDVRLLRDLLMTVYERIPRCEPATIDEFEQQLLRQINHKRQVSRPGTVADYHPVTVYPSRYRLLKLYDQYQADFNTRHAAEVDRLQALRQDMYALRLRVEKLPEPFRLWAARRVRWTILGHGEHPFPQVLAHYRRLQTVRPDVCFDIRRLETVYKLKPDAIYVGSEDFDGYVVFTFARNKTAVLECPVTGNAIYVLRGEWRSLSTCTKAQLLSRKSDRVTRIVHSGDWEVRLRAEVQRKIGGLQSGRRPPKGR